MTKLVYLIYNISMPVFNVLRLLIPIILKIVIGFAKSFFCKLQHTISYSIKVLRIIIFFYKSYKTDSTQMLEKQYSPISHKSCIYLHFA